MINTVYSKETISDEIHTKWAGKTVHFAKETDSTNEWCKRMSKEGAEHGTLAVAEFQSAGKGRLGRRWTAPEGSSVMMSILLRPEFEPQYASMLTLVMGLSVAQAVKELDVEVSIKWPNDVVVSRKKICGILTEMSVESESGYIQYLIIGIGINVNGQAEDFPAEIRSTATSLAMETGKTHSRAALAAALIRELDSMCRAWPKEKTEYLEAYRRDNITTGKEITVVRGTEEAPAFAVAIGDDFSLRVRYADGRSEALSSGEISIRGLYGEAENRN